MSGRRAWEESCLMCHVDAIEVQIRAVDANSEKERDESTSVELKLPYLCRGTSSQTSGVA